MVLKKENIKLDVTVNNKEEAISRAGWVLVENGYVESDYVDYMIKRENVISTYVGNNVAVPHGISGSENSIKESGISILRIPAGVDFGDGNTAKLVIGIAGKDGQHMDILGQIAMICSEPENVDRLMNAGTEDEILDIFQEEMA
jgi:mannitol PTS system EIIA component